MHKTLKRMQEKLRRYYRVQGRGPIAAIKAARLDLIAAKRNMERSLPASRSLHKHLDYITEYNPFPIGSAFVWCGTPEGHTYWLHRDIPSTNTPVDNRRHHAYLQVRTQH